MRHIPAGLAIVDSASAARSAERLLLEARGVDVIEHVGLQIDGDATSTHHRGDRAGIGDRFDGERPAWRSCSHRDETLGRHAAAGIRTMRCFGVLTVSILGSVLFVFFLVERERARQRAEAIL